MIFSFIDVLLNFLKYLRSVLFRKECFVRSVLVYRLLVTLSYFRPDRFVQFLILIPLLILLLYFLVSIDLVYIGLCVLVLYASIISSKKMIKSFVASAKVIIAFLYICELLKLGRLKM